MVKNLDIDITDESKKPVRKNVHDRIEQGRVSAHEMDENRRYEKEYEYLCYMAQARDWITKNTGIVISNNLEFKEELRKGEILVELARVVSQNDSKVYRNKELVYRHTDNHNVFIDFLRMIGLNECYYYGVLDAYDDVNIPSVIYCLHALSNHLQKRGYANKIEKKRYVFSEKELSSARKEIKNFSALQFDVLGSDSETDKKEEYVPTHEQLSRLIRNLCAYKAYKMRLVNTKNMLKEQLETMHEAIPKVLIEFVQSRLKRKIEEQASARHNNIIKMALRRFLMKNPIKEVLSGKASLFSIREVLKRLSVETKYAIDARHKLITEKLKENYVLETEIDTLMCTIEKVLDNKRLKIGLDSRVFPTEYNKKFEKILFFLQTEPRILLDVLSKIEKDEQSDFIARYLVPLFNTSSERDKYLILKLIDEDNNEMSSGIYSDDNLEEDARLSYRIIVNLFRSSSAAVAMRDALLITDKISVSNVKENYIKSLTMIKDIVTGIVEKMGKLSIPHYILYFFSKTSEGKHCYTITDFYIDFISPFIIAPDAFPNFKGKFDRNTLLTIDSVFKGILKGEFDNDYYVPLSAWGHEMKEKIDMHFASSISRKTKITGNSKFRISRPMIQFSLKELNQLLNTLKMITTNSKEFNELVGKTRPYEYYDNEFVSLYLSNPVIKDEESEEVVLIDDLIDVVSVTKGRDLENVLGSANTKEEECLFRRLQAYKAHLKSKYARDGTDAENENDTCASVTNTYTEAMDSNSDDAEKSILNMQSLSISDKDDSKVSILDTLKKSIRERIDTLNTPSVYAVLQRKMCERIEELRLQMSQRRVEMKINSKTLANLKKQNNFLRLRLETITEYYDSLLDSYFVRGKGNCSRKSVYGTYKYKIKRLLDRNMATVLEGYGPNDPVYVYISCDRAGVIDIAVAVGKEEKCKRTVTLDGILNDMDGSVVVSMVVFSSKGLLRIVNDRYIRD